MRTTMLPYSKKLCNGDETVRPPSANIKLKCIFLHYDNPYLKLLPFKYEPLSENPHVGMFRDFYSHKEIDHLVDDSKEKLHSTVFYVSFLKIFLFVSGHLLHYIRHKNSNQLQKLLVKKNYLLTVAGFPWICLDLLRFAVQQWPKNYLIKLHNFL